MDAILFNNTRMVTSRRPSPTTLLSRGQPLLVVLSKADAPNFTTIRRSGNYKPTMWDFQYIQSVNNCYASEG